MMERRGLILGIASLLAAPAIVRASSLMPIADPEPWTHWSEERWLRQLVGAEFVNGCYTVLRLKGPYDTVSFGRPKTIHEMFRTRDGLLVTVHQPENEWGKIRYEGHRDESRTKFFQIDII